MTGSKQKQPCDVLVAPDGNVSIGNKAIGRMDGFVFTPTTAEDKALKPKMAEVTRQLKAEAKSRADAVVASADPAFSLDSQGQIIWRDAIIGQLKKGATIHTPQADLAPSPLLPKKLAETVGERLQQFASKLTEARLSKLYALTGEPPAFPGKKSKKAKAEAAKSANAHDATPANNKAKLGESIAHAIAKELYDALGVMRRKSLQHLLPQLDDTARRFLARWGVRVGIDTLYMPHMLKPSAIALRSLLFSLYHDEFPNCGPPPAGRVAIDYVEGVSDSYWLAAGYRRIGKRIMRVDMAERLLAEIRTAARAIGGNGNPSQKTAKQPQGFRISDSMLALAGVSRQQMADILVSLGYVKTGEVAADDKKKPPIPLFMRLAQPKKPAASDKPKPASKPSTPAGKPKPAKQVNAKSWAKLKVSKGSKPKPLANGKQARPAKPKRKPANSTANNKAELGKVVTVGPPPQAQPYNPDSPFAVLAELKPKQK